MQRWLKEDWIGASARKGQRILWRDVEATHVVATMSLVDTLDEQYLLEKLLEDSKPPMPFGAGHLDYLIFTPFRYTSTYPSRFRKPHEPGIWYGAFDRETAFAEVGYWRWRFLMNSDGLGEGEVKSEHTLVPGEGERPAHRSRAASMGFGVAAVARPGRLQPLPCARRTIPRAGNRLDAATVRRGIRKANAEPSSIRTHSACMNRQRERTRFAG
ncbi:MAG: RES family NAD+ phosphorylase [Candidatus Protistobacter heckmanni]|nr:RES family NAD+ phosphorylase [Candidatus Protistobacter heckmanni]